MRHNLSAHIRPSGGVLRLSVPTVTTNIIKYFKSDIKGQNARQCQTHHKDILDFQNTCANSVRAYDFSILYMTYCL
jgi:predicted SAM-dependent methyltransferase